MNALANLNVFDLLALADRTEDPRLKGEILLYAHNETPWGPGAEEFQDKIENMIDDIAMDLVREEVTLDMDYVALYKVYRDCENDGAESGTFAHFLNCVREEVTYELLCMMAEREAKVLGEVITKEEFNEKSFNDFLLNADIRAEGDAEFPEGRVSVDSYFWEVIGL